MKKKTLLQAMLGAAVALSSCSHDTSVTSPDGRIRAQLSLDERGVPALRIDVDGSPLLEAPRLGLEADGLNLASGFTVEHVERQSLDVTWTQPWGENRIHQAEKGGPRC